MNFQTNFLLTDYNTFHLTEYANKFCRVDNEASVIELLNEANIQQLPLNIMGGGSNILLTKPLQGITCLNELKGISIVYEDDVEVKVNFKSGENWHDCVRWCIQHQYAGIENLSLIPGTIGAAPIQNIGAYGVEIKEVFVECECIHLNTLKKKFFTREECEFGYRDSVFKRKLKNQYFILSVTLRLFKQAILKLDYGSIKEELQTASIRNPTIVDVSNAVIQIRQSKLPNPNDIGNAGSFFKNPVITKMHFAQLIINYPMMPSFVVNEGIKIPAAWLIEQLGWKGFREDDFGVHENQALVLVNYGNAKGASIFELSNKIIISVNQRFNILLEREVNVW
jgi:UDP-N-acetylmuramate dehydrogenase